MKFAVIGATGYIGRHLISILIAQGHSVIAVVRDIHKNFPLKEKCTVIESGDNQLYSLIKSREIDSLIYLAWGELDNYNSFRHINYELEFHFDFISSLIDAGLKSLIVSGTCLEYGKQSGELSENMKVKPENFYAIAKNELRKRLVKLQSNYNFNLVWTRIFYIYGDDQGDRTLFGQIQNAIENKDKTFNMSKGDQTRDYISIDKLSKVLSRLLVLRKNIGIINVCSGIPKSVKSLVEDWLDDKSYQMKLNTGFYSYNDYEPLHFWGNSDKLNLILERTLEDKE